MSDCPPPGTEVDADVAEVEVVDEAVVDEAVGIPVVAAVGTDVVGLEAPAPGEVGAGPPHPPTRMAPKMRASSVTTYSDMRRRSVIPLPFLSPRLRYAPLPAGSGDGIPG